MTSDTRSARKSRDSLDGQGSKKKLNMNKDSLVRSPGKTVKASTARQTTTSPLKDRNSKRHEKALPSTPAKRTSERLWGCNTPDSVRRSGRYKKDLLSRSASNELAEEPLSKCKKKREKTLTQVTMESKKPKLDLEVVGTKRKKMNARKFKALFKRQRIKEMASDGGNELEKSEKLHDVCSYNSSHFGSQAGKCTEDIVDDWSKTVVGKLRDESIQNDTLQDSRQGQADVGNDINVDSCLKDYVVAETCSKYSQTNSSVRDMSDSHAKLLKNCSSTENNDASESSQHGSVSANCSERCIYDEEDAVSASLVNEYCIPESTCRLCSKKKRVGYDSPEQELCSCSPMDRDLIRFATCKAKSGHGAAVDCGHSLIERHADSHMDGAEKLCGLCNKDGYLIFCEGKSCKRSYHLSCLDPPLSGALPGVWYCPHCVKKKLLFGVHSVSDGVESIWDVREVEVPNAEGLRQKQFLVKYRGLAHAHNHWVPEKQLLFENPDVVSSFLEKDQNVGWNAGWMIPHCLLRKRSIQDKIFVASNSVIWVCENEWLVKWHGLNYDHATWELDTANFLSSSLGQNLVKGYAIRRGEAERESNKEILQPYMVPIVGQSEIAARRSHANQNHASKNVNKLRAFLLKCPNAVVFYDQEQATTVILLIDSMIETFRPFLIVTTYDSLSRWEADFERLAPSVNVIVYSENSDTRTRIRTSGFFDEGGCKIVQVLLASVEAVLEDFELLRSIKWKTIVIDEYQYSEIANGLPQMKMLSTDMRILLASGQIKDATSEYLNILSFIEAHDDFDKLRCLKSETHDNLSKLKCRLSHFIAYGKSSQVSKFIEFWVPVELSNLQLEHYCATLLSKSNALCSCASKDPVGVLPEILQMLRKCCSHPYLVDSNVQSRFIEDKLPAAEILDYGIKACGKLQLLDAMLTEIKERGLEMLILFQLIGSPLTSGNILHDFLIQRIGLDACERVDAAYSPFEKQAAVNRFNEKKSGQFVFLLENRACSSLIKLSSLDVVVIYDSDWNPANDLKALKKLSIDSKVEQIKVFRLYSSFTIEERALVLAKQNLNLDNNSRNFNRCTSNTLLSWGATNLFSKLDEYHADCCSSSALNFSSGQSLLDEVTKDFQAIVSGNFGNNNSCSIISEAKLDGGNYSTNTLMFGESKVQLKDREVPHVFWKNLFEGKNPLWKNLMRPSPRNRKRVHYREGFPTPRNSEVEKDNVAKKRKKLVNESLGPTSCRDNLGADEVNQVALSNGGPSAIKNCKQSENQHRDGQSSVGAEASVSAASKQGIESSDVQQSHGVLQREMKTLCQTLKLPDNVIQAAEFFLEYVIKNHHVNSNSTEIVHAFQLSVCWVAASLTKQKIDKRETLMSAKQLLGYQCTEEQASSVYSKMRSLKGLYLQFSDSNTLLNRDSLLTEEDFSRRLSSVNGGELQCSSHNQECTELELGEKSMDKEHAAHPKVALKDKSGTCELEDDNELKNLQKKCDKRMKKLVRRHQEQIQELLRIWEDKKERLEKDYKLGLILIRSIRGQTYAGMDKLKVLNDDFKKKIEDHDILRDADLENLKAKHLIAVNEERQKAADWLAEAKACTSAHHVNAHQSLTSESNDDAGGSQPRTCVRGGGDGDKLPMSDQLLENENPKNVGLESSAVVELLNQSKTASDDQEAISTDLPAPQEQVSDEIQSVDQAEGHIVLPETAPIEILGNEQPGELSSSEGESNKVRQAAIADDLVSQRGEQEMTASVGLHSPGQPSFHSEKTIVSPGSCNLLPQKDSDALGEESRSASQTEISILETADPVPSISESPINDNILTSEASTKSPVREVFGQLHSLSVNASLSCNQLSATVNHNLGRSSVQSTDPEGTGQVLHESVSQTDENLEMHPERMEVGPASGVSDEQIVELPVFLQRDNAIPQEVVITRGSPNHVVSRNDVAIPQEVASTSNQPNHAVPENDVTTPQEVVSTSEWPNQSVPPVVNIDAANLHGPGFLVNPTHQPTSWNSAPSLMPDPLQNDLERMSKEIEQMEKSHADMMAQLRSDCVKEIEEITSQILNGYKVKCQETEAEFRLKRSEYDKNQKKLLLNKMLADAFRSKCLETRPPGFSGMPRLILPTSVRPSPGPPASQPPRSQPTTTPTVQTMPQLPRSQSVRPSPTTIRNVTPHPVQGIPLAGTHVPGSSARPPVISAISPSTPRAAGNICSMAPHLKPCRPTAAAPVLPNTSSSIPQPRPSIQVSPQLVQLPSRPSVPDLGTQNSAEVLPRGLVADYLNENRSSHIPDAPTFHPLEQSCLEILGNAHNNQTSVVCLSDDE